MDWNRCFSHRRILTPEKEDGERHRSAFSRDADRIIFSTPFRRLQDKTQIFSLPGSAFVHNRLTHSLEVAAVGRSLGAICGYELSRVLKSDLTNSSVHFYRHELSEVIYAACLAHDIGNPAFGHSGEDAICSFFRKNGQSQAGGLPIISFFNTKEWNDLIHFEGNANAIRILAGERKGKQARELNPTVTTLATLAKYPCESMASSGKKGPLHRKKFGFLQAEKEVFRKGANLLGMRIDSETPLAFFRHPFVFLLEAADDICYSIVDLEDAARLNVLPYEQVCNILKNLLLAGEGVKAGKIDDFLYLHRAEPEKQLSYLRSRCIGMLIDGCSKAFVVNHDRLIQGDLDRPLIDILEGPVVDSMQHIKSLSAAKIYNSDSVIKMELAGYRIFSELLNMLVPALLSSSPDSQDQKALHIIPLAYRPDPDDPPYEKMVCLIDYLSSMTDNYALELYRNIAGIDLPRH